MNQLRITPRCEIHQPSFRFHLISQFAGDDDCLRLVLRKNTLYVYYPVVFMIGELVERVKIALKESIVNPIDDPLRNLLSQPPRELINKLLSQPLHQMGVVEFVGKFEHESGESEGEKETYEYRIRIDRLNELFRQARLDLDVKRATLLLKDEQGISEQLLIEKYEAVYVLPISHARARAVLAKLVKDRILDDNGNRRKWGYDVVN